MLSICRRIFSINIGLEHRKRGISIDIEGRKSKFQYSLIEPSKRCQESCQLSDSLLVLIVSITCFFLPFAFMVDQTEEGQKDALLAADQIHYRTHYLKPLSPLDCFTVFTNRDNIS